MEVKDKYIIDIPMSKEDFVRRVRDTTKKLNYENQAYRKTMLASYEEPTIRLSYAGASMNGGGFEMLEATVEPCEEGVHLEGEFKVLPWIRFFNNVFWIITLAATGAMAVSWLLDGNPFLFVEFFLLMWLYRKSEKIGRVLYRAENGRRLVIDYIENELGGSVEIIKADED